MMPHYPAKMSITSMLTPQPLCWVILPKAKQPWKCSGSGCQSAPPKGTRLTLSARVALTLTVVLLVLGIVAGAASEHMHQRDVDHMLELLDEFS